MIILSLILSIPVILVTLYYSRTIGVLLIIARSFYKNRIRAFWLGIVMMIVGTICMLPRILISVTEHIPTFMSPLFSWLRIVNDGYYPKIFDYGYFLLIAGIIYLVIEIIFSKAFNYGTGLLMEFIKKESEETARISMKNDMKMKEKQLKSNNTKTVICPTCGASNIVSLDDKKCKYCIRQLL